MSVIKFLRVVLLFFLMINAQHSFAQFFDGGLDYVISLGVEPGSDYTSGIFAADAGLGQHLSVGMGFRYLIVAPEIPTVMSPFPLPSVPGEGFGEKFGFSMRADIHAYNLLNLEKSDILLGIHRFNGANGVHLEYRKFLNEFIGFYARPRYNFTSPRRSMMAESDLMDTQLFIQVGFFFKTLSGNSYEVDW